MKGKEPLSNKLKAMLLNFRVWTLIILLAASWLAINPTFDTEGVLINGVAPQSRAELAGLQVDSTTALRDLEQVLFVNDIPITTQDEYYSALDTVILSDSFRITTDVTTYTIDLTNATSNLTADQLIGISVRDKTATNVKLGIELEGGSRIILQPQEILSSEELDLLVQNLQNRLDIYGASGTKVSKIEDSLSGQQFVVVESTSSNKNDLFRLIERQGHFEARFNNNTAFTGDDVVRVLNDPQNSFIQGCSQTQTGAHVCSHVFAVLINDAGATNFLEEAKKLSVRAGQLSAPISFYLDGNFITELSVASDFKFKKITTPQITVSGNEMPTEAEAIESAKQEVKFLQAILSTQSLPTELDVVQSYSISSTQGADFLSNALWVGLLTLFMVALVVAIRYKHIGIFISILIALIGELIIVFGFAALLRLTIDLAAIGGLIAAIGTGVDDQIIITDEYFRKRKEKISSKRKIKKAFAVVLVAYATTIAAMWPLSPMWVFESIKLLEGFAFMIIAGVTIGVLITRPAFAAMLRILLTTKKERDIEKEEEEE